ncbi:MAG: biotin--[acetyl-CoA-carboxylase] ligase [Actinomycetota bacterium]|nr:biotin--[acetyl-CoA-carboxylase] ligase [Actinomycetota bacterium]
MEDRSSRRPLDPAHLRARLVGAGRFVPALDVVSETTSTNADLLVAAARGAPEGTVLVAEYQRAGRGRLGREWVSPPGAGLTFSLVLRPDVPRPRWSWLPLLAGLALRAAVADLAGDDVGSRLKWPNDLLLGARSAKAAGILVQTGDAAVVGVGVNVDHAAAELPGPAATSLRLAGAEVERSDLLVTTLEALAERYLAFIGAGGDAERCGARAEYRAVCATLGTEVEVQGAGGGWPGRVVDIGPDGSLIVERDGRTTAVSAGDVIHLRARPR